MGVAKVGSPVLAALSSFAVWLVVSLLMHLATRLFGGVLGSMLSGLRLLAGAGIPVWAARDYLAFLVSLGFSFWYVVLVVIGASLSRNISYGEWAGPCALSCVGFLVLIIMVVVAAAIGIFATVKAAAP